MNRDRKRLWLLILATTCSLSAAAAPVASVSVTSATSTVRQLLRYTDELPAHNQVLVVEVNDPLNAAVCRGGWLRTTDGQFRDVFQILMAAKLSGLKVRMDGDSANLWNGSSDKYCYISFVGIY